MSIDTPKGAVARDSEIAARVKHAATLCEGLQERDLFLVDPALLRRLVEATSRLANLGQAVRIDRATGVRHDH